MNNEINENNNNSKSFKIFGEVVVVKYLVGLLISLLIFFFCLAIAKQHTASGWNERIFYDINNLSGSFKNVALYITEGLGAAYPIIACILIPVIYKRWRLAWRFFVTVGGAGVLMEIAKIIAKQPRPNVLLHGHLNVRAIESGLTSFPSGHESVATAMALTMWLILPAKWRFLSVIWILIVAVSRVYLGVHMPIDVIGGFGIGLFMFFAVKLLPSKLAKTFYLDKEELLLSRQDLKVGK